MTKPHRQLALRVLKFIRQTSLRRPVLKTLVALHNSSYHWISFFSSHTGIHPKHSIMRYHQFFLAHISSSDTVADLGCGKGEVAHQLARKARRVIAIDNNPQSLQVARQNAPANIEFRLGDITKLTDLPVVDVIILSNVLEHIEDRVALLRQLTQFSPKILIRVPMLTRDWISVYKKNEGFEYRLDHTHFIEYTLESFKKEMSEAGLVLASREVNFGEIYAVCTRS